MGEGGGGKRIFYYLIIISLDSSLGVLDVCVWVLLVMMKHLKTNVLHTLWIRGWEQNPLRENFMG